MMPNDCTVTDAMSVCPICGSAARVVWDVGGCRVYCSKPDADTANGIPAHEFSTGWRHTLAECRGDWEASAILAGGAR